MSIPPAHTDRSSTTSCIHIMKTEQEMINEVARTGCGNSYTTVKGVVQPHTVYRSVPVSPASPRTQTEGYQGKGKQGGGFRKGHNPQSPHRPWES